MFIDSLIMYWILITLSYLIVFDNQINATFKEPDDISAEFFLSDNGHFHLNLTWEKSNRPSAVKIESLSENCSISCGQSPPVDTTSAILPEIGSDSAKSIRTDHECIFIKNCWYNIIFEHDATNLVWNKTLYLPACVNDRCLCDKDSAFPKFSVWGKFLSKDNIKINWSVNVTEMATNSIFSSIKINQFKSINISVHELTVPEHDWGGKHVLILEDSFPLNIDPNKKNMLGYWVLHSKSTFLSKHVFLIKASIIDSNGCPSEEERFQFIVPKELENDNIDYRIVAVVIIIGILFILILIYTTIQKSKFNFWKNRCRNIVGSPIVHIPMESNILYIEKDSILNSIDDYFEISPSSITIAYRVDGGTFGTVFKGYLKHGNGSTMIVAIKQLKKTKYSDIEEDFLNEVDTMKNVGKHKHIVEFLGCCTKQKPMMMIMEYVGGGSLLNYLERIGRKQKDFSEHENDPFRFEEFGGTYVEIMLSGYSRESGSSYMTQNERCRNTLRPSLTETMYTNVSENNEEVNCEELHNFALQIAEGMQYLEEKGITHRDLAARNILITEKKILKISDFGLSRNGIYIKRTQGKIPWKWLSIEAMQYHFYSSKSDVWAFGVVLWEIGTLGLGPPYPNVNNSDLLHYLLNGNRLDKPDICSDELYNLMTNCWKEDLDDRPSFYDILKLLRPEGQNLYVQLNNFGSNYVFPPLTNDM